MIETAHCNIKLIKKSRPRHMLLKSLTSCTKKNYMAERYKKKKERGLV